ncbi:ras-related protein Rab-38-like [Dysidea avara]|uniref:ras-related protein Rab-38-like n=1 Tax=Dysidea avara TaxID=196820 RepID=UPI003325E2F1
MSEVQKARPLKIVLLGDVKVGKSSLIDKYQRQNPTASTDGVRHNDKDYVIQLWDVSGGRCQLPGYSPWQHNYCKEAMGVIYVYDVQTKFSLQNLSWYRKAYNSLVTQLNGDPIPAVLVGNKHDVGELDGSEVCEQLGIEKWFYVSANTGENVNEAFEYLIKKVAYLQNDDLDFAKLNSENFDLYDNKTDSPSKSYSVLPCTVL